MNTNSLVIGLGEVGKAIQEVLACDGRDLENTSDKNYGILHICYPWNDEFIEITNNYKKEYNPNLIIIHSTVKLGTSRQIGAVHSPIRGKHPNLAKGIRTFVKFFGGQNETQVGKAAQIFGSLGIETYIADSSETTEAIYGVMILLEKEIHSWCKDKNVDFNVVYTEACKSYNEGYAKLGYPEYCRPILKHIEGKIGGHCVRENSSLLTDSYSASRLIA